MSAYCFAVQIGMPEGLESDQQQIWLHRWRDGLLAEIDRLQSELDNERGHREADNRESRVEIDRLKVRLTCLKNDYATYVNDVRTVEEAIIEQREAEIERLRAELAESHKRYALLVDEIVRVHQRIVGANGEDETYLRHRKAAEAAKENQ